MGKNTKRKRKGNCGGHGISRVFCSLADFSFHISCILPTFQEYGVYKDRRCFSKGQSFVLFKMNI